MSGAGARERLVSPAVTVEDRVHEASLRPSRIDEFVGQAQVTDNLKVYLEAARRRGRPLDHVLLAGPPGLGKTSLAHIIAAEMGAGLKQTAGPALERAGDLAALLTHLERGDILFIDEIHRLGPVVEEVLYPAMEDFSLDLTVGQGPGARSVRIELPPYTLVGATTRAGLLSGPLRNRFGITERLDFYPPKDLAEILERAAPKLGAAVEREAASEVASRARGTPRVALRLLRRLRDFADVQGDGRITAALAREALVRLGVDELGLDALDRRLLSVILEHHGGGPVGVNTIAAALGEEPDTLEEVSEPFLIQIGFLERTPRGRMATERARQHVGVPRAGGPTLFG